MNTLELEQEIVEKFRQLPAEAQQRVLDTLSSRALPTFDYTAWWAEVSALQAEIRGRLGQGGTVGALELLDELREESS